jgi:hypothetical protein
MHSLTKESEMLQKLREEPQVDIDIPSNGPLRSLIERLKMKSGRGSAKVKEGKITTVYYLVGDERRAVRKFIEENSDFVKTSFELEKNNPLSERLPEEMYWLMKQEYEIMNHNGEI